VAANFRNRISMEPMRSHAHGVKGAPFFSLGGGAGVGVGAGGFQVVFGVESGLSPVHFPLDQWTVDFPSKPFFLWFWGGDSK
jgi:hypothetical protein